MQLHYAVAAYPTKAAPGSVKALVWTFNTMWLADHDLHQASIGWHAQVLLKVGRELLRPHLRVGWGDGIEAYLSEPRTISAWPTNMT